MCRWLGRAALPQARSVLALPATLTDETAMNELTPPQVVLAEIEALQDEVLRQLDELNVRIERTLAEFGGAVAPPSAAPPAAAPAPQVKAPGRGRKAA